MSSQNSCGKNTMHLKQRLLHPRAKNNDFLCHSRAEFNQKKIVKK